MKRVAVLCLCLLTSCLVSVGAAFAAGGDTCAAATPIVIPVCDGTATSDMPIGMTTATDSGAVPGSCFMPADSMDGDRWYSWTNDTGVPQELFVTTDLVANYPTADSEIAIFDDCIPTTELTCGQDGGLIGTGLLAAAITNVADGATAMIAVDGWYGDSTFDTIEFSCTPSPVLLTNETCAACTEIPSLPFTDTVNTDFSFASPPPGSCNTGGATEMQNDIWYCITPTADCDIDVAVDTDIAIAYDGLVAVHSGASCASLSEVTCVDEPEPQMMTINATAGTTYYIQIGDLGPIEGGGVTRIDVTSSGACAVPVELQSFSVD